MKISSRKELFLAIFTGKISIPTNMFVNLAYTSTSLHVLLFIGVLWTQSSGVKVNFTRRETAITRDIVRDVPMQIRPDYLDLRSGK